MDFDKEKKNIKKILGNDEYHLYFFINIFVKNLLRFYLFLLSEITY